MNFKSKTLSLNSKIHLRAASRIEIPPRSQSVFSARIKNQIYGGTSGVCHPGRALNNLGLQLAHTVCRANAHGSYSEVPVQEKSKFTISN